MSKVFLNDLEEDWYLNPTPAVIKLSKSMAFRNDPTKAPVPEPSMEPKPKCPSPAAVEQMWKSICTPSEKAQKNDAEITFTLPLFSFPPAERRDVAKAGGKGETK